MYKLKHSTGHMNTSLFNVVSDASYKALCTVRKNAVQKEKKKK